VADVVDHSGNQERCDSDLVQLQGFEDIASREQVEGCLSHIRRMKSVVIRLRIVRIVNDSQERTQLRRVELQRVDEGVLLESVEADGLQGTRSEFLQRKDVEMPTGGLLEDLDDLARQPLELCTMRSEDKAIERRAIPGESSDIHYSHGIREGSRGEALAHLQSLIY
jgi:hypothetical protein